jgi:predicted RNA-binding Zn-ribbon protein involved in translation (DUF1610 family)
MGYLHLGQFRKVNYTDDGCTLYQCMWCKSAVEIRDDPTYWHFCPRCGKSWFKAMDCRPHNMPRWVWERGGEEVPYPWYPPHKKPTHKWIIEERSRWPGIRDEWSDWEFEEEVYGNCWQYAYQTMNRLRADRAPSYDGDFIFEYRALIRRDT